MNIPHSGMNMTFLSFYHVQKRTEGSLGNFISSMHSNVPFSQSELLMQGRFSSAGPWRTLPNLSQTEPWQMHTHPLYAPRQGMGTQPRWVQTAEHTNTWVFPAGFKQTWLTLSSIVDSGSSFSCCTSCAVSLLMKTGVPFHTICKTSPGGISEISTSRQVLRSYLVHPLSLPMMATAQRRAKLAIAAQQTALNMQIWVRRMSVSCQLCTLFQSNQLSRVTLKSMWSPKFPGRAEVTKNWALSGIEWLLLSFFEDRQLYSVMRPKLKAEPIWEREYAWSAGRPA